VLKRAVYVGSSLDFENGPCDSCPERTHKRNTDIWIYSVTWFDSHINQSPLLVI